MRVLTDQERCRSKKFDGTRCKSPVEPGTHLCHFHHVDGPLYDLNPGDPRPIELSIETLKNAESIQATVARVCEHLLLAKLDAKRAAVILYGLQVATSNLPRLNASAAAAPVASAPSEPAPAPSAVPPKSSTPEPEPDPLPPGTIQAYSIEACEEVTSALEDKRPRSANVVGRSKEKRGEPPRSGVQAKTSFLDKRCRMHPQPGVPEGQASLAQRFSAGNGNEKERKSRRDGPLRALVLQTPGVVVSSAPISAVTSPRVRSRYQKTIATRENKKMIVEIALISGVIPRRSRPQISSGKVLSRPIRKKLTAISSIESVKIKSAAPIIESLRFGTVMRQNVCQ